MFNTRLAEAHVLANDVREVLGDLFSRCLLFEEPQAGPKVTVVLIRGAGRIRAGVNADRVPLPPESTNLLDALAGLLLLESHRLYGVRTIFICRRTTRTSPANSPRPRR